MASIRKLNDGRWQAQFRPVPNGKQITRTTRRKVDAQRWLDEQTSKLVAGAWVDPQVARTTVGDWCDTWLAGYSTRRASTVRQANVHIAQILRQFASVRVAAVRPSDVRAWTAKLKAEGLSDSYVYACHNRLSQILEDAVHDGILARNPCSRRTSPPAGKQRPYVATSEQVWALYAAYPDHLKPAILLGAFVGLRTGEAAGLRTIDVDLTAGFIRPAVQHPAEPLKTEMSRTPIPIPADLAQELASYAERYPSASIVSDGFGGQASPWAIERAMRSARRRVHGLPAEFRFHDLRHYFASLLIAAGCDIKTVQTRVRHGSAKTTLDTYGHLFPDADESTRAAVSAALAVRMDSPSGRADERLTNGNAYQ